MDSVLAVDIGGTKISVGVVDADGRVARSERMPTARAGLFDALASLIGRVADGNEVALGVGCGGPMTGAGRAVSPLNIPQWRDFPLHDHLVEAAGLPVFVDND